MSDSIVVATESGDLPAQLFMPPTGHGPGIVVLHDVYGVTDYIERRAAQLAELGYVVIAPEIYVEAVGELDWQAAVADGAAAVQYLRSHDAVTGGVGIVGFCFGGGLGFNIAAHLEVQGQTPVAALVSYYGSALPGFVDLMQVSAPSLHHFGLADSDIDPDTVRRIEASVTRNPNAEFHTYAGAGHAFDNDDLVTHHAAASVLAWERTVDFLRRWLPVA